MSEAVKLAKAKPDRGLTRDDLLVYGGWLTSEWSWSRDVGVPLDTAIANASQLGEEVRLVGRVEIRKAKPAKPTRQAAPVKIGNGKAKKSGAWDFGRLFARPKPKKPAPQPSA